MSEGHPYAAATGVEYCDDGLYCIASHLHPVQTDAVAPKCSALCALAARDQRLRWFAFGAVARPGPAARLGDRAEFGLGRVLRASTPGARLGRVYACGGGTGLRRGDPCGPCRIAVIRDAASGGGRERQRCSRLDLWSCGAPCRGPGAWRLAEAQRRRHRPRRDDVRSF